jgi:hypothetical protein
MKFKSIKYALLIGLMLCAVGIMTVKASSSIVTFSVDMSTNVLLGTFVPGTDTVSARGTFNAYGTMALVQDSSKLPNYVYTNTVNDTADTNGGELQYKFYDSNLSSTGWENPATGQNRAALLPLTSGASLVLPTPFFSDAGAPTNYSVNFQVDVAQQVNLGNFIPGTSSVEVRGLFNGWTGGVTPLTNNTSITVPGEPGHPLWQGSYLVTNSPNGAEAFKYVIQPGTLWDSPSAVNQNGGQNRYFTDSGPQTLPLVNFSDAPFSLQFCTNVFNVDMSVVVGLSDTNFNRASLTVNGDFNGWGAGIPMTNNPSAANTNIYTSAQTVFTSAGTTIQYQYRYTNAANGNIVYDHLDGINGGGGNRVFVEPLSITFTNLPTVLFNDAESNDYILQSTPVLFSVNMMSNGVYVTDALGHQFNPTQDSLYINGQFANNGGIQGNWYPWAGGVNPTPAPPGYQMVEVGTSTIYTNTISIPGGTPVKFAYLYGMDTNSQAMGPIIDENTNGVNHNRVLRSTGFNPYVLPADTFGNQYSEPLFSTADTAGGNLTVGAAVAGKVPVMWLGRPGAHLQSKGSLTSGVWLDIPATDGTNWTAGSSTTNGFMSLTNWPSSGNTFFRLVKP